MSNSGSIRKKGSLPATLEVWTEKLLSVDGTDYIHFTAWAMRSMFRALFGVPHLFARELLMNSPHWRVFTRRRCRDVQRRLRLVWRRSRASFVARRRLQNVNMRGLGHCAPQTGRDSTGVSNVSKNVHQPVINPLLFSSETFHKKKMSEKKIDT